MPKSKKRRTNPKRRETRDITGKNKTLGTAEEPEIFLPVKQSGKEVSLLQVLQEMKQQYVRNVLRQRKYRLKRGKHCAAVPFSGQEKDCLDAAQIDVCATVLRQVVSGNAKPQLEDLMCKRFSGKRRSTILFAVDASRSQGAKERLAFAKGAVMAILLRAYCDRDRVGMLAFGNKKADWIVPFTKSVDLAAQRMKELKASGNTPLAMGLRKALQLLEREQQKYPDTIPVLVLLTDGKSNYDSQNGNPLTLLEQACRAIARRQIPVLVVDTENSIFGMGLAKKIARQTNGRYVQL